MFFYRYMFHFRYLSFCCQHLEEHKMLRSKIPFKSMNFCTDCLHDMQCRWNHCLMFLLQINNFIFNPTDALKHL